MTTEGFKISISDDRLAEIKARLKDYPWGELPDAGGWTSGVGKQDLQRLVAFWEQEYDWRAVERRLNEQPQFVSQIDGVRLHFIHRRGDGTKPPLLLLHGWPGSFLEFEELIAPLCGDGHDVVVPSLPGFAFSGPLDHPVGPKRAAQLMRKLMQTLFGDERFFVQGGDWGAGIGGWMAQQFPDALAGLHVNMLDLLTSGVEPETDEEREWHKRQIEVLEEERGYSHEQETRPQTLGAALSGNPVGAAGWILEKFGKWSDVPSTGNGPDLWAAFSEELLVSNIMLYVAPPAIGTSLWMYRGKRLENSGEFPPSTRITTPTGVAAFPDPVFQPPPRTLAQRSYNIVHWSDMPAGGHFAALEQPALLLGDLRVFIGQVLGDRASPATA